MDIKKRTKSVKEKLNQLGYNVKLTHCREVLAVAHGLRNSHQFETKNQENKLKPQTMIYLKVEEDPCERRETNKGFSCALMYLGSYTEEYIKNRENLDTLAEHLWENNSYVDDLMNEIMDRSNYFSTEKEAFEDALKLAKKLGYYVVNRSDFPS